MSRKTFQIMNFSIDLYLFSKQRYHLYTLDQASAERSLSLISYKDYTVLGIPKIMLQMMPNSSSLAHTASRYYYLRLLVEIQVLRLLAASCKLKILKFKRIITLEYVFPGFFVKYLSISPEYFSCSCCHWTVYIDKYLIQLFSILVI